MSPTVLSFWGKGGVGKTTLTFSLSLELALRGKKTIYLTTDPTPPLPYWGSKDCDWREYKAKCGDNLELYLMSEKIVRELWIKKFGEEVYEVASSIFPVEREVIDYVAGAPGIADEFLMYFVQNLCRNETADYIVWDTTAAGGSIRLIRLEKEFYEHLGQASKMYLKIKGTLEKIRRGKKDPAELIDSWRKIAEEVLSFLSSSSHKAYIVSIPDYYGLQVTSSIYEELTMNKINVEKVILNMVFGEEVQKECKEIGNMAREQKKYIQEFFKKFEGKADICMVNYYFEELQKESHILEEIGKRIIESCIGGLQ
ncbi:ArsA family ATPase [Fervidicoccus fontis]|uniref:ArsA family ATPase n=1 Tax=Fervidicoccus fontis TaxID=683846 RepID=A0A843AGQ0_9CREN|nr:ArsA family ATPase [Fervidicoccus fontis]MBE9390680.1 ArsA family ATPase [Fervidicoccus fontis]